MLSQGRSEIEFELKKNYQNYCIFKTGLSSELTGTQKKLTLNLDK